MEYIKILKNIKSLSEYIQLTEDAFKNNNYSTIEFNMSAVLDLKEMRYYEIQYFKNYGKNGIAYTLFEQMLALPASKTWNFLGKEMVLILRFWLKAMKEILLKNQHWWSFMKRLLILIKDLRTKHTSLPDMLVEQLTEYLLYVATQDIANVCQKFEILHCLNIYCAESSRHIRLELRNNFEKYFAKLSSYMASCGHLPCQFSILETLLRWIIPRSDPVLRSSTAQRWFREPIFTEEAINIFLERPWLNFFQDARDFLNAHNGTSDIIVSVKFSTMMIGEAFTIPEMWLDVNSAKRHICISVLLLPRVLRTLQPTKNDCSEALTIKNEDIQKLTLVRKSLKILLLIKLTSPPTIEPSHKTFDDNVYDLVVNLDPHSDFKRLDSILRAIFDSKYEANLDLVKEEGVKEVRFSSRRISQSPKKQPTTLDNEERFSQVEVPQRSHIGGYVCTRNNQFQNKTLSSTSTSSLLLLRDVADQRTKQFLNEPKRVSAGPDLSTVSELTESIESSKFTAYGVSYSSIWNKNQIDSKTTTKLKPTVIAPINNDDVSCLLVATIGSTDESVINDTLERVSKNTNYEKNNIVDLLIHEALENSTNVEKRSNTTVGEPAENIFKVEYNKRNKQFKRKCTVISRSTSNESHTEYIKSPSFITKRKRVFPVNQVDVEQCLNKLIDEVCAQLDKLNKDCNKSMKKKEFDTEDERPLICLAKRQIDQKPKKKRTMVKKNVKSVNTINQKEFPSITNNVSISNITIHSPETHIHVFSDLNSTKDNNHPNRKRKLYSPKFEPMDSEMSEKVMTKSTTSGSKLLDNKISNKTEPVNTFYKDIKTQTKTRIRAQPKRKNRSKQVEPTSPKTELINKKFDQLKETRDNTDDIVYVDKNEYNVFNYSSDSDDFRENVKTLREKSKKNISATGPVTVNKTTNNKTKSRRNYVRKKINTVGNNKIDSKRSKSFNSKLVSENNDLVDEKMRNATSVLNNSILIEKPTVVNEEPVLVLDNTPEMEFIGDNVKKDTDLKPLSRKKRKIKQTYKTESVKKCELTNNADKTQSPLPELFIEPALPTHQNNTSNMDTDAVIKSINRIRELKPDFNVDFLSGNESKGRNVNKNTPKSEQTQFSLRPMEKVDITVHSTRPSRSALAAMNAIHSIKKCNIIKTPVMSSTKSTKRNKNRRANKHLENKNCVKETALQFNRSVSNSMKVYHDSNESSFNTCTNIKTTPRKLDIEGYDAAAKHYYRKVMNDVSDRSGEISIPGVLESCRKSNTREETRSELSGNWEPRVILEDIHKSSASDRRSDIEDKSVKVNSRKAVVPTTTKRVDDTAKWLPSSSISLANATVKSVTKTSMNKKLHKLNNTANNIEANEKVQSRQLLSKTANVVSDDKTPKSSRTSPDSSYRRKSEKADDRQCGSLQKSFEVEAITENTSSKSPKVKLLSTINNIFGKTEASTSRAKGTGAHVTDTSDKTTATPILKTVTSTLNNTEEESRIETLNNEGTEKVHQCISSTCLFCEWKKKNDAASSTGCTEKKLEELKDALEDALEHVCGYLDVTLTEVSEKSKEKYAYLFIEIMRQLDTMEDERKEQIAELTKRWDTKFKALKESIKRRSCDLINEDFKAKQAIVKMLREDVTAVKDWMSKKK
ncbi:hypothetical protein K1T71_012967 [Dendrolimus kikuchii]|uniref:Uncharacterized protein n=1 Tax=Dendrolimus kikuchii TaxID=765133 RepID=A0ACC1CIW2_9NEOP|nr:hypothetical protein K1T71_012967 [Dendrolimus kikuchii]